MKVFTFVFAFFLSFSFGVTADAKENSPDKIILPKFKCPIEVTLYVIYEPSAGPNRKAKTIMPVLSGWGKLGTLIGECPVVFRMIAPMRMEPKC